MQHTHNDAGHRLAAALEGTESLNPGLESRDGQLYHHNKALPAHQERLQLFFKQNGCLPSMQHYTLLTPHAVSSGASLECSICLDQQKFLSEQYMTSALQAAGLDGHFVLQWQPSWWHGRVDYYFPAAGLVIQVDGAAHFVANRKTRMLKELVATDLVFNVQAFSNAAKVMRVHHKDQEEGRWLVHLIKMVVTPGPLLILSPSFAWVKWMQHTADTCSTSYVGHLRSQLPTHKCSVASDGYISLTP